ncbi:gamma-glutamyltransferase [soil metagenome]
MAEQCTGRGVRGVVCAAAPLAAAAGAAAMRDGGNAFDAVTAAALAETVLLPSKCGLGGDVIALVLAAGSAEPEALLAIGGAPRRLAGVATSGPWSDTGPLSVGVPAAAAGYLELAARGSLTLDRLAAPAIDLATNGFPWAEVNHRLTLASIDLLERWNPTGTVYLPVGEPARRGTMTRLPRLADAISEFVARRESFLAGPVGDAIIAKVRAEGGILETDDLATARARWTSCAAIAVDETRVWATPAPTFGPALLDAVRDARPGDGPAAQFQRFLDANARRLGALADPSGTSAVSAADRDGNVAIVVHSNSYPRYGSGLIVPEYDLVLANRAGRGFTAEPGHPNFPVAGRRPATTLHAWMATTPTGASFVGGTPGGDNQVPWNMQLLQHLFDGQTEPGRLVTQPRWAWLPTDGGVRIEAGFDDDAVVALGVVAPRIVRSARWALACAQQVIAVPVDDRVIVGAADPRTVGLALGV